MRITSALLAVVLSTSLVSPQSHGREPAKNSPQKPAENTQKKALDEGKNAPSHGHCDTLTGIQELGNP